MASFLLPLSRGESPTPLLKKKAPCPNFRFILILNLSVFTFCLYIRMPHFSSPPTRPTSATCWVKSELRWDPSWWGKPATGRLKVEVEESVDGTFTPRG